MVSLSINVLVSENLRQKKKMEIEKEKVISRLTAEFIGSEIHIFDRVGSTNDIAKEIAISGCKEGAVVIADSQSKGRGRLGRRWESPSGVGIYLSIILKPKKVMPQLTLVAGVSVAEAINESLKLQVTSNVILSEAKNLNIEPKISLKWPNDININGKKAGGILTEGISKGKVVIVGIGINVNTPSSSPPVQGGEWGGEGFPDELKDKATSILIETGESVDRNLLIAELLNRFEYLYEEFMEKRETVMKMWRGLSDTFGRRIRVSAENKVFEGVAEMIDSDGSLMIRMDDGFLKRVSAGEICY